MPVLFHFYIPCSCLPHHLDLGAPNSLRGRKMKIFVMFSAQGSVLSSHSPPPDHTQGTARPYLSQTLLSCPHRCVDDLQEELSSSGIEDENGSIDGFCGQIPFKSLRKRSESEKCREINGAHPHLHTRANSVCALRNCVGNVRAALCTLQKSGSMC